MSVDLVRMWRELLAETRGVTALFAERDLDSLTDAQFALKSANTWLSINAEMQRIRRHLMEGNNDNPEMVLVQALGALSKHDTETVAILAKRLLERYP